MDSSVIIQVIQLIIIFLAILYIKSLLPSYMKEKGKNIATKEDISDITSKIEEVKLAYIREAEAFRATLNKEVEVLKINHTSLQVNKAHEFVEMIEYFTNIIGNFSNFKKGMNEKKQRELNTKMVNLGVKLFFFASDDTVLKYTEWRRYSQQPSVDNVKVLKLYAELILLMRKDLGYGDTKCTIDDFLYTMLTDWDKFSEKEKKA